MVLLTRFSVQCFVAPSPTKNGRQNVRCRLRRCVFDRAEEKERLRKLEEKKARIRVPVSAVIGSQLVGGSERSAAPACALAKLGMPKTAAAAAPAAANQVEQSV